jgi:hypothetical protein
MGEISSITQTRKECETLTAGGLACYHPSRSTSAGPAENGNVWRGSSTRHRRHRESGVGATRGRLGAANSPWSREGEGPSTPRRVRPISRLKWMRRIKKGGTAGFFEISSL